MDQAPSKRQSSKKRPAAPSDRLLEGLRKAGHTGECPYGCPVCAAIGILKQMSPDVSNHLAAAAREFVLAAKAFLDGVAERDANGESKVERIPLD